jgi:hypothetical protein
MALTYTPTSELDAVNAILAVAGESPVNSLEVGGLASVDIARQILHETSREIQSQDWEFNSEYDYPLPLTTDGNILLPPNVLKIDVINDYIHAYTPVMRGDRLYDKKNHTDIFPESLKFDIVFFLPFDHLPESLRKLITIRAARVFQRRYLSSDSLNSFTEEEEARARAEALAADASMADYNMADNYDVFRVMDR